MATLVSPGVSVTVIDQSNYAPTGPGTVPFILLATAENKTSTAGGIASYTTAANSSTLQLVASQKELLSNYGLPIFPTDASGNRLFGSETAEYGLMAAHSVLGITNQAYILRADIDLAQLTGSSSRPYGSPAGGTQWLDTALTNWGIFTFSQDFSTTPNPTFNLQTPLVITSTSQLVSGQTVPLTTVGTVGQFAVVSTDVKNPIYQKAYDNSWNLVGSTAWQSKTPAIRSNVQSTNVTQNDAFTINGTTITVASTGSASNVATQINNGAIPGVTAAYVNGYFYIFVTSLAKSNGSTVDGKLAIANSSGTPLTAMFGSYTAGTNPAGGWTGPGTYYAAQFTFANHYNVPLWKSTDGGTVAPSGSVWIKTTAVNNGASIPVYRWNSATSQWVLIPTPIYSGPREALYNLDPTLGGLGIALDTLYIMYDANGASTATFKVFQRIGTGPTVVTGTAANPTFTTSSTFGIEMTNPGLNSYTSSVTVTLSSTTAASFVTDVLAKNIPYLTCSLDSTGHIVFSNTAGGQIRFNDGTNTPLATAGFSVAGVNGASTTTPYMIGAGSNKIAASLWADASDLYQQSTAPVIAPTDGTIWYYNSPLEVDIMINNGTIWKGYKNLASDSRGYNLQNTDPLGAFIQASAPTTQSDGTALVYGDLWVDTSDLENYPMIYRWQRVSGTDQWVAIDNTDHTSENGIVFADARWDIASTTGGGMVDPALGTKPTIVSLLTSDYVDLDAPNPQIYPRGTLLFNTRRSSYNVKQYVASKFNSADYPLNTLPDYQSTWQSLSGKDQNGVPYFGRKAVRNVVVSKLAEALDMNDMAREDQRHFNLLVCPGYPELTQNLVTLNNDRRNTAFILADSPMGLSNDLTKVSNYVMNTAAVSNTDEDGLNTSDSYVGTFYPGAAYTNALDGIGQVVVPITHAILRMVVKSDQNSHPWFAPAGTIRGKIDNVSKIGYVDRATGTFVSIGTNQGLRDLLYENNVNPVAVFPTEGILNYGNHTRQATATALDRINVARLVNYLRYNLERLVKPLVFEPNDTITRNEAKQAIEGLLNDIVAQRGIYDYLVVCDTTNNTPATIDRNELHIDIAIEPTKAVEFIYVPVRILNTGAIAGTNPNQGGLSNVTPSVSLGA